jgi:hypothetical protein
MADGRGAAGVPHRGEPVPEGDGTAGHGYITKSGEGQDKPGTAGSNGWGRGEGGAFGACAWAFFKIRALPGELFFGRGWVFHRFLGFIFSNNLDGITVGPYLCVRFLKMCCRLK